MLMVSILHLLALSAAAAAPPGKTADAGTDAMRALPVEGAPPAAPAVTGRDLGLVSAYQTVAVMPLSSLGSTEDATSAIERVMVHELGMLLGERMIPPSELLEEGREAADAFLACEGVVVCLREVIGSLGWDAFIASNMAGLGTDRVINMKLMDVRTGGEVRRAALTASGDESQLIDEMRKAAVTLLAPELLVGTLHIAAVQSGIQITVDGKLVGATPLAQPRVQIPVGRHAVEASGEGLVPFSTMVDIQYNEVKQVTVVLPENTLFVGGETPYRTQWWTWSLAGAGLVAMSIGAYFNYQQSSTVGEIERRARRGTLTQDRADLYDDEKGQWRNALIFYGTGAAILSGVGVLFTLDFL